MKVAVYHNNNKVLIEERPVPEIQDGEILVKVKASGICGTDVMEWYRVKKGPRVLGHEIAGEIIESKAQAYPVGKRVFVSHHVPCNDCKYCKADNHSACEALHKGNYIPGGYSEFIRVPVENVERGTYVLDDSVTFEEATMIEPLACSVRAQRVTNVTNSDVVLVLGCGVSGLTNIQIAKLKGAHVIATDINEARLAKAREFGADEVYNAKDPIDVTADKVFLCSAAQAALETAYRCVDKKGTILFYAIPSETINIPLADLWRNEVTLTSSYGAAPKDLAESLELITSKKVDVSPLITHKFPLSDIQEAFNVVSQAKDSLKVVLLP